MALTKESIKQIHADLRAALDAVAKKHNLVIAKTHITYTDSSFKFTSEIGSKDVLGDTNPIFYKDIQRHGWKFGLTVKDIGREFKIGARTYKLEGMKGYNFVIGKLTTDGKLYKLRGEDVAAVLGTKNALPDFGA